MAYTIGIFTHERLPLKTQLELGDIELYIGGVGHLFKGWRFDVAYVDRIENDEERRWYTHTLQYTLKPGSKAVILKEE